MVLALRAIYLARFGHDPCGMNFNFLLDAKAVRFGYASSFSGMPLVRVLLFAMRSAGASAAVALGAVYVAGHLLLALGVFGLSKGVLSEEPRSRIAVAIAAAVLPAFSTDAGYRNVSCTLAAGLFAAFSAVLLSTVGPRPRLLFARLAVAFALSALVATCRPEAIYGVAALAVVVAWGRPRLNVPRRVAVAAVAGLALGLVVSSLANHHNRELSPKVWAYYHFFQSTPALFRMGDTEYARYAQAVHMFGGFDENGGSIARALLRHPGKAALWLAAKPFDLLDTILQLDSFTPLAVLLFFPALWRLRREGWHRSFVHWTPILCAYGAPLAFLVFCSPGLPPYLLIIAPLLLLFALWGLQPWIESASASRLRPIAWGTIAAGAVVAAVGHGTPDSVPVLEETARWLERRCASGCLVNALPQPVDSEAWADLQAGAPLPLKDKRAEAFALRRYPPSYLAEVRLVRRFERARERGWKGPILYVRPAMRSLQPFHPDFDPEHALEGDPDLSGATLQATFHQGQDTVQVFELKP
ncbi:MAG TPA: hypothetical protein VMK12_15395 [Anaeromyxobacteraceae bacterium]|nr:hypothetical protein [Anaeromyxobacteraceae bacterium]